MEELLRRVVADRVAVVVTTEQADGDFHPHRVPPSVQRQRQHAVAGRQWVMLDQVHGTIVYEVDGGRSTASVVGVGDVLVVARPLVAVAIWAADCAPVVLVGARGTIVAFHAGWRGLAAGVVGVAAEQLATRGEPVVHAVLGPAIHACCYEFGQHDLRSVAAGTGLACIDIAGTTGSGRLALDVPATVGGSLAELGIELDSTAGCTGCDRRWFSHRIRRDRQRHALVAWTETENGADS